MKAHFIAVSMMFAGLCVSAQNTTFTYQGELNDGGSPANGTNYDITFSLYDANPGGDLLGTQVFTNLTVSNGLFTVALNFGAAFNGSPRWLELKVGPDGGKYITLTPRQQITPTPYAIFATTASNVSGTVPASQLTGSVPSGSLTSVPAGSLTGSGALPAAVLPGNVALLNVNQSFTGSNVFTGVFARGGPPGPYGVNNNGYAFSGNSGDNDSGMYSLGDGQIEFFNNNLEAMRIQNALVGIGVTNPVKQLQVDGDVGTGPGGTNYAASSLERLQVIRGIISSTGGIVTGSGFTVQSNSVGNWTIYFNAPTFAPAVTVSSFSGGLASLVGIVAENGKSYCIVQTTINGSPANIYFCFIAAGSGY